MLLTRLRRRPRLAMNAQRLILESISVGGFCSGGFRLPNGRHGLGRNAPLQTRSVEQDQTIIEVFARRVIRHREESLI